ncbi:MAG: cobalamin-binding protein [Gammaproteobacteria bacterium]
MNDRVRVARSGLLLLLALLGGACGQSPSADPETLTTARRIVSLAPHLTEMAYAAGAGSQLVAVVEFSDYPAAARQLPRIGDSFRIDYERLAGLQPDLILAWQSGNPAAVIARLSELGYRVEAFMPRQLDDVAEHLQRIGELAGTTDQAGEAAADFRRRLQLIRERYRDAQPVRVFYQVSAQPLITVSEEHFIGQVMKLCGGRNVFSDSAQLVPVVSLEAVLDREPAVILAGAGTDQDDAGLKHWQRWPELPAVRREQLYAVPADLLSRAGPRLLAGADAVCEALDKARAVTQS